MCKISNIRENLRIFMGLVFSLGIIEMNCAYHANDCIKRISTQGDMKQWTITPAGKESRPST